MDVAAAVLRAEADSWAVEGELRRGGGAATLRGIRVAATGLPQPQFNSAIVTGPEPDLDGAGEFFAAHDAQWDVRVPEAMPWTRGRRLFRMPLMGVEPAAFRPAPPPAGLELRAASAADLETVLAVDAAGFGGDPDVQRRWIEPHLDAPSVTVALAELDGEPVGTAYTVRSGAAIRLSGVAVVPEARRRGIGATLSAWLCARGFARGARLAHLHADTPEAARVYARLGFAETGALVLHRF